MLNVFWHYLKKKLKHKNQSDNCSYTNKSIFCGLDQVEIKLWGNKLHVMFLFCSFPSSRLYRKVMQFLLQGFLMFNTEATIACKSFWCYDVILGKLPAATFSQLFGWSCWDDLTCRLRVVSNSPHLWMISMIDYRLLGMVLKTINRSFFLGLRGFLWS